MQTGNNDTKTLKKKELDQLVLLFFPQSAIYSYKSNYSKFFPWYKAILQSIILSNILIKTNLTAVTWEIQISLHLLYKKWKKKRIFNITQKKKFKKISKSSRVCISHVRAFFRFAWKYLPEV
jgi:hypothetical protein